VPPDDHEQLLHGGIANEGAVVRIGDTVRRPWRPTTPYAHAILARLDEVAPGLAPRPLGRDAQGREVLSWLDGDVAIPPFPAWATTDACLESIGRLLRRVHDALAGWQPDPALAHGTELADPLGGNQVCHTDVCPENVICRDGRAVALIDWDFATPGRSLWDVVSTARLCVPFVEPGRRDREFAELDVLARLRLLADAYGLTRGDREAFGAALMQRREAGERFVRAQVAAGHPGFVAKWGDVTADARHERERVWIETVQPQLADALGLT
jgi:hypothetical protein